MKEYIALEDATREIKRFEGYLDDDMITRIGIALSRLFVHDVAPVKHSRWLTNADGIPYCESCEGTAPSWIVITDLKSLSCTTKHQETSYCPHCGALMDACGR